jgi:hypothetical protein
MFLILIGILVFVTVGFIVCLALRAPLIRSFEERHGLSGARKMVEEARADRVAEKARGHELDDRKQALKTSLDAANKELAITDEQLKRTPQSTYVLVFELGTPEAGMQPFEFILTRTRRASDSSESKAPDRELWAKPRLLRTWARNQQGGFALAQTRFTLADGFILRVAERVAVPTGPAAGDTMAGNQ